VQRVTVGVVAGVFQHFPVDCPAGKVPLSGGYSSQTAPSGFFAEHFTQGGTTYSFFFLNQDSFTKDFFLIVVCANAS
jgi:hypothetical protein